MVPNEPERAALTFEVLASSAGEFPLGWRKEPLRVTAVGPSTSMTVPLTSVA